MLAYQIMSSANPSNAARLIKWIDHPDNVVLVTVDALADTSRFRDSIPANDRIHIDTSVAVTWGGITQVQSTLNAIRILLSKSDKWRYFINITDTDVPLKHQEHIFDRLREERRDGIVDFLNRGQQPGKPWFERFSESNGLAYEPGLVGLRSDVRFLAHPQLRAWFARPQASPIWDPWKRLAAYVTDKTPDKTLAVRPLYDFEADFRANFFADVPPVFGRLWSVISRETCEKLVSWSRLPEALNVFSHTFCPDENFLHSIIWSGKLVPTEQVSSNTYRLRKGDAISIHDDMIHEIDDPNAFFGRKILSRGVDRVVSKIDAITRGNG